MGHAMRACFAHDKIINHFAPSLRLNKLVECNIPVEIQTDTLAATVKRTGHSPGQFKKYVFHVKGIFKARNNNKMTIPVKDTVNPLSHQVLASLNFFNCTQALAPVKVRNRHQLKTFLMG